LEVGNNFVVNVEEGNNEGQEFWVVCCTKPLHKLTTPQKCKWGMCRNLSLGLVTKAKGFQGCEPRGNPGVKAKAWQGCGPRGSRGVTSHTPGSVRKCEGV